MAGTKVGAVIDALVAKFTTAAPTTPIYDGLRITDTPAALFVIVGHTDDPNGDEAATVTQEWAAMSTAKPRTEIGTVNCVIVAQTGGANLSTLRATATALSATLEAAIRADVTLSNGGAALVHWASYAESGTLRQTGNRDGLAVSLEVVIGYRARIN